MAGWVVVHPIPDKMSRREICLSRYSLAPHLPDRKVMSCQLKVSVTSSPPRAEVRKAGGH